MAQAGAGKRKGKAIKDIFHTMDYGTITEGTDLLQSWLQSKNRIFDADTREDLVRGAFSIKDVNSHAQLADVYCYLLNVKNLVDLLSLEWCKKGKIERAILMKRLATEIESHSALICQVEMAVRAIRTADTKSNGLPALIQYLRYYSSWAVKCEDNKEDKITVSYVDNNNFLGVFGMILGPALASGYSIILHTEPEISLVAFLIVELAENLGFPKGTIRIIPHINTHDKGFKDNGGTKVISIFERLPSVFDNEILKDTKFLAFPYTKIPTIVFNTADVDSACDCIVASAWACQGMLPGSTDTVLVQEDIFNSFVTKLKDRVCKIRVGDSNNITADVSYPICRLLAEEMQQKTINDARALGIEVFQKNPNDASLQPTLLIGSRVYGNNVTKGGEGIRAAISLETAVTVMAFRTANEAASLANNSRNGFGAIVWSENISLANEMARKLDVANIWINTNAILNPAFPMSSQKNHAGYFGGLEGLLEYTERPLPESSFDEDKCALPKSHSSNPVQLFYGNSFQKSESGLVQGAHNHATGAELNKAIAAAKKGYQTWRELTLLARAEVVRKAMEEVRTDKRSKIEEWILAAYEGTAQLHNLGTASMHKTYDVRSTREPVGVVGVEGMAASAIIGSLLLGNAVVVLLFSQDDASFAVDVAKAFVSSGAPAGVFNVLFNCNKKALDGFFKQKDMNVFLGNHDVAHEFDFDNPKRICYKIEKWADIIRNVTNIKNVWTSVGDSLL